MKNLIKIFIYNIKLYIIKYIIHKQFYSEIKFFITANISIRDDNKYIKSMFRSTVHQLDKRLNEINCDIKPYILRSEDALSKIKHIDSDLSCWGDNVIMIAKNKRNVKDLHEDKNNEKFDIVELIKRRRSIRSYSGKPLPDYFLNELIECALWAPTGCNRQNIEFLILNSKEDYAFCQKIAGEPGKFVLDPPLAIVVMADCRSYAFPGHRHQAYIEAGAAIQNMFLYATFNGVGSICLNWAGLENKNDKFRDKYKLGDYMLPIAFVLFGYSNNNNVLVPVRKKFEESVYYS